MAITENVKLVVTATTAQAQNAVKGLSKSFEQVGNAAVRLNQSIQLAGQAAAGLRKAMEFGAFSAELRQLEATVNKTFIKGVQQALGGTVDQLTLMREAAKVSGKVTSEQFTLVMKAAQELSHRGLGETTDVAGKLFEALKKGETTELRKFGLSLKATGTFTEKTKELMQELQETVANPVAFSKGRENFDKMKTAITDAVTDMKDIIGQVVIAAGAFLMKFKDEFGAILGMVRDGFLFMAGKDPPQDSDERIRKLAERRARVELVHPERRAGGPRNWRTFLDQKNNDAKALETRTQEIYLELTRKGGKTDQERKVLDEIRNAGSGIDPTKFGGSGMDKKAKAAQDKIARDEAMERAAKEAAFLYTRSFHNEFKAIAKERWGDGARQGIEDTWQSGNPMGEMTGLPGLNLGQQADLERFGEKFSQHSKFQEAVGVFAPINTELELQVTSFQTATSAAQEYFTAIAEGGEFSVRAVLKSVAKSLRALGIEYGVRSIGALALGLFGDPTKYAAAAKFAAASAAAFVGSGVVGGMAGGGGGASASAGAGAGLSSTSAGSINRFVAGGNGQAGAQPIVVNIHGAVGSPKDIALSIHQSLKELTRDGTIANRARSVTFK